jgi:hypothetical protein
LTGYVDLAASDRAKYFKVRERIGDSPAKVVALKVISLAGGLFGCRVVR